MRMLLIVVFFMVFAMFYVSVEHEEQKRSKEAKDKLLSSGYEVIYVFGDDESKSMDIAKECDGDVVFTDSNWFKRDTLNGADMVLCKEAEKEEE